MLVNAPPRGLNHLLNDLNLTKFDASSELNNSLGLLCWFATLLSKKDIYCFIVFSFGVTFSNYHGICFYRNSISSFYLSNLFLKIDPFYFEWLMLFTINGTTWKCFCKSNLGIIFIM